MRSPIHLRALAIAAATIATAAANAFYVNIGVTTHDYCGNATGSAAMGSNAPGPLTILWSTGATSTSISGLSAGIIWVDVVDGMGTAYSDTAEVIGYTELPLWSGGSALLTGPVTGFVGLPCTGQCNGAFDMPGPPTQVPTGPFTYTFDASITFEGTEPFFGFPVYSGFCSGVTTNFTYTDVNGCTGNGSTTLEPPFTIPLEVTEVNTTDHCQNGAGGTAELILESWLAPSNSIELYLDGIYFDTQSGTLIDSLPPGDYTGTFYGFEPDIGGTLWPYQCGGTPFSFTIYDMGPDCGTLEGDVWYDLDADCVFDGTDPGWSGQILDISPGNVNAYVNTSGHYSIQLPAGNYSVGQVAVYVDPICPAAQPVPFTINGGTTTVDLASMSTQPMDIALYAACGLARPGFDQWINGQVRNLTVQTTGPVTVVCVLDPNVVFVSASPTPIDVTGNTVTWDLGDLSVFGQAGFHVVASVPITVPLGAVLSHSFTASNTLPEATLTNNVATTATVVTGSYDPNDKTARTSSGLSDTQYFIDQDAWIDYTVRFQNTGTDTAFTVVITDTLDVDLDMLTFEQGAASHPVEVAFRVGSVVQWTFNNILLPDSNTNEAASHGLVNFRIAPVQPLLAGTVLSNNADIFFDFNEPVRTNTVTLTADFSTGIGHPSAGSGRQLSLVPNPASDVLNVIVAAGISAIEVLTIDGRSVQAPSIRRMDGFQLDVRALPAGLYCVRTDAGTTRFVKH